MMALSAARDLELVFCSVGCAEKKSGWILTNKRLKYCERMSETISSVSLAGVFEPEEMPRLLEVDDPEMNVGWHPCRRQHPSCVFRFTTAFAIVLQARKDDEETHREGTAVVGIEVTLFVLPRIKRRVIRCTVLVNDLDNRTADDILALTRSTKRHETALLTLDGLTSFASLNPLS